MNFLDQTGLSYLISKLKQVFISQSDLIDSIYPVGSIYMSTNSTNPSTIFGGEWESWGGGRVIVGVGTATDDNEETKEFSASNLIGGEYNHTLTLSETPAHTHGSYKISGYAQSIVTDAVTSSLGATGPFTWSGGQRTRDYSGTPGNGLRRLNFNNTHEHTSVGGDQSHNNIQPYITCYLWRRIT